MRRLVLRREVDANGMTRTISAEMKLCATCDEDGLYLAIDDNDDLGPAFTDEGDLCEQCEKRFKAIAA